MIRAPSAGKTSLAGFIFCAATTSIIVALILVAVSVVVCKFVLKGGSNEYHVSQPGPPAIATCSAIEKPELIASLPAAHEPHVDIDLNKFTAPNENSGFIVRLPGVSDEFARQIHEAAATLPVRAVSALSAKGYKIVLSPTITDAVPSAKDQQVRGYKQSATWNSVFGMFNRSTKKIVMAEKAEDHDKDGYMYYGELSDMQRRKGILRHECGHALDEYLGSISHSPSFQTAYKRGLPRLSSAETTRLEYYLQPGYAGSEETVAELFAAQHDCACDCVSDDLLKRRFPELLELIKQKTASL